MAKTKKKEDPAQNLAHAALDADVRDWREVRRTLDQNVDEIKRFKSLADDEGALRKRIGLAIAELKLLDANGKASLEVDGKVTIYEMGSRSGGRDWEGSWGRLYAKASPELRAQMDGILCDRDPVVLHKLVSQ